MSVILGLYTVALGEIQNELWSKCFAELGRKQRGIRMATYTGILNRNPLKASFVEIFAIDVDGNTKGWKSARLVI